MHDQVDDYQNILKLSCWPLAFISYKAFQKNKMRSGISLSALISARFLQKIFLTLHYTNLPTFIRFIVWLPLFLEMSGNMCIVIICFPVDDIISIEINLSFLIKSLSYMTRKNQGKKLNILISKRAFNMKQAFSITSKEFSLKQIKPNQIDSVWFSYGVSYLEMKSAKIIL